MLLTIFENCKGCPPSEIKNIHKIRVSKLVGRKVVDPPSGHNLCEAYHTQRDLDISPIMSPISFRRVASSTSIRTRFKSLTALELNKLEVIKSAAYVVAAARCICAGNQHRGTGYGDIILDLMTFPCIFQI